MTFGELKQEVVRLCQFDADEPTLAEAGKYVNFALKTASRMTRHLIAITEKGSVATREVDLGSDVADIEQVWWNTTLLEPDWTPWTQHPTQTGTPARYQSSGSRLLLFPAPASSGTLRARVVLLHPTLTIDSQTPSLPEDTHLSVAWYAAALWLMAFATHNDQIARAGQMMQNAIQYWIMVGQQAQQRAYETRRTRSSFLLNQSGDR